MKAQLEMILKRDIICLLLLVLCSQPRVAQGQINMYNASLVDTSLSILYRGIDNEIVISGWESADDPDLVRSSGIMASLSDRTLGHFTFVLNSMVDNSDTLRLFVTGELALERIFTIVTIPNPVVQFGELSDTIASVEEILADPNLRAVFPGCEWIGCEARMIGYDLTFQLQSRKTYRTMRSHAGKNVRLRCKKSAEEGSMCSAQYAIDSVITEDLFTGEMRVCPGRTWNEGGQGASLPSNYLGLIAEMKSGDRLVFNSIKYIPQGGCPRSAHQFTLTIRE